MFVPEGEEREREKKREGEGERERERDGGCWGGIKVMRERGERAIRRRNILVGFKRKSSE